MQEIADLQFVLRNDAFDEGPPTPGPTGQEHLAVEAGGCGFHAGNLAQAVHERPPVAHAIAGCAKELHVCGGSDETSLEVAAHAGGDSQSDDERGYTGGNANDGDGRDESDDGLATSSAKIARGDEKLEPDGATLPPLFCRKRFKTDGLGVDLKIWRTPGRKWDAILRRDLSSRLWSGLQGAHEADFSESGRMLGVRAGDVAGHGAEVFGLRWAYLADGGPSEEQKGSLQQVAHRDLVAR